MPEEGHDGHRSGAPRDCEAEARVPQGSIAPQGRGASPHAPAYFFEAGTQGEQERTAGT